MLPEEIERASFAIIEAELAQAGRELGHLAAEERAILVRAIHATADFDLAERLVFHPQAVPAGLAALRRGAPILTDVHMVQVGISAPLANRLGCQIICDMANPAVALAAREAGATRATMAMRRNAQALQGGIVAIGNAPTALLEVIRLVQEEAVRPALIVGVPVGFVNAAESKDALAALDVPHITVLGRKGGSTVAVAIVNALLRLATAP